MNPLLEQASEVPQKLSSSKKRILLFCSCTLLLLVISLIFLMLQRKTISQPAKSTPQKNAVRQAPTVHIDSLTFQVKNPTVPQTIAAYALEQNLTKERVLELGKKFGLTTVKELDSRFVSVYDFTHPQTMGYLVIDKETGGYTLSSYGETKLPNGTTDTKVRTLMYLTSLGLADSTVTCPVTYKRKPDEQITYVECHRDWQKTGLSILSFVGLLNTPLTDRIDSLRLGDTTHMPSDASIVSVTGTNTVSGKARPNDFNTITVGVTQTGTVQSIKSNMRFLRATQTATKDDLVTPDEAIGMFKANKAALTLTMPQVNGNLDWERIYPENKAHMTEATVTDYTLSYLENPPSVKQQELTPMYTIRGKGKLTSGYTVSFVATVPALKKTLSYNTVQNIAVLAATSGPIQMQPYYPGTPSPIQYLSPTPTTTPIPGTQSPDTIFNPETTIAINPETTSSPTETNTESGSITNPGEPVCRGDLDNILNPSLAWAFKPVSIPVEIPGLGTMIIVSGPAGGDHTFWYKSADFPINTWSEVLNLFYGIVEQQYLINIGHYADWYKNVKTVDEAKQQFRFQNGGGTGTKFSSCLLFGAIRGREAPIFNCETDVYWSGLPLGAKRANAAADHVAQRVVDAVSNGTLADYGKQPDIFPEGTRTGMAEIFIGAPDHYNSPTKKWGCLISGESPSLFLYPQSAQDVKITLSSATTYTYPTTEHVWNIHATPQGVLTKDDLPASLTHLYYEYNSGITFNTPFEGFMVTKKNWEQTVRSIAHQLGLTTEETRVMIQEVSPVIGKTTSPYIKLSIASTEEINTKLPLDIQSNPDHFYRVHIMVSPLNKPTKFPYPVLHPLIRKGFTAIEIGARLAQ